MNTECNRTEAATFSSRVASIREIERRRVPFKTNPGHTPICNAKKYQFFKTLNANRISKNFLSRTVTLYNDIANSIDSSFFSDTPILFFLLYNPCLCSSRNVDANPRNIGISYEANVWSVSSRIANAQTGHYFRAAAFSTRANVSWTRNDAVSSNIPRCALPQQDGLINPF